MPKFVKLGVERDFRGAPITYHIPRNQHLRSHAMPVEVCFDLFGTRLLFYVRDSPDAAAFDKDASISRWDSDKLAVLKRIDHQISLINDQLKRTK